MQEITEESMTILRTQSERSGVPLKSRTIPATENARATNYYYGNKLPSLITNI